ncbi:MAG: metallophosphoesterase [Duncaniella sp.]|nr:metallophosphoesterase [Duncaniella sp.]HBI59378.1 phosphoesterase [Porphyromonadaceae bacterium]
MRLPLLILGIFTILSIGVDWYILSRLKKLPSRLPSRIHIIVSVLMYLLVIVGVALPRRSGGNGTLLCVMWILYAFCTVYVPKIIFVLIDLLASIPCILHRRRIKWLSAIGVVAAVVTFVSMWWGALVNRYDVDIREVTVEIPGLPKAFDGYRIVQFSDFHVGTYGNDTAYVAKVVDCINGLDKDLVVFTGDIVNARTSELLPHASTLSRLKAPDGVLSILGNHDYGDYSVWPQLSAKEENIRQMHDLQREKMNWRLLLNETAMIHRGNDSIAIIGVENIGDPPFHIYGSLSKAYPVTGDSVVKILLTHNPAHWVDSIADSSDHNIALSLSGHTHAMQMEVAGWSPAAFRYPTWGGLYSDKDGSHKLYVNIGMGTVGIPARIGATPEITIITLKAQNQK